jgi:hypothetical protein
MLAPEFSCLRTTELSTDLQIQYLELFQAVFRTPKPEGLFERQFLPGPEEAGYHGLMLIEGRLNAAYSAIPLSFIFENKTIRAALVVDALVHPDFQGKSLLRKVLDPLYSRMKVEGFEFLYGMPNTRFQPILTRTLGWRDLGQMNWFVLFPGGPVPHWIFNQAIYRSFQEAFVPYRFLSQQGKQTDTLRYWESKTTIPGCSILLDWNTRNPHHAHATLSALKKPGLFIFPALGKSSGGLILPHWIRGKRTFVAAYPLSDLGKMILESEQLWLTLADFDVG